MSTSNNNTVKKKPAKGQDVGYLRVSSVDQNLERQLADVVLDEAFEEKASGKDRKRPVLERCIKHCRKGDVLHVHSIDRLARNLADLEGIVKRLNDKGVSIQFHKENLTFSGGSDNPMNRLMLQMMGAFAQFERSLIRERQREGIAARKAKGLPVGAKPKLSNEQLTELKRRVLKGENKTTLARDFDISRQTLYRLCA